MAAKSRRKGAVGERETAEALRSVFPLARRGRGQYRGGADGSDIEGCEPFHIENKRAKRPNIPKAIAQAVRDMAAAADPEMRWPVAITKADRSDALVTMRISDWLEVVALMLKYEQAVLAQAKADAAVKAEATKPTEAA